MVNLRSILALATLTVSAAALLSGCEPKPEAALMLEGESDSNPKQIDVIPAKSAVIMNVNTSAQPAVINTKISPKPKPQKPINPPPKTSQAQLKTTPVQPITRTSSPIKRCMNMSAMEAPNEGDWYNYKIKKSHLRAVAAAGFDTIRLPIRISVHTSPNPPYTIKPKLLSRIDQIINWSSEYNLQVIVDLHHFYALNDNADKEEPRLMAIWDQLAKRYANAPPNVMFELLNEPYGSVTNVRMDAINRRLLKRIRQDNPTRWVIVGPADYGGLHGMFRINPPKDPRILQSFHYYTPFEYTHQGSTWTDPPIPMGATWGSESDKRKIASDFSKAQKWADKRNISLFVGEFGTTKNMNHTDRAKWTKFIRQQAEEKNMSWCYWGWIGEFEAWNLETDNWIWPIKDALFER